LAIVESLGRQGPASWCGEEVAAQISGVTHEQREEVSRVGRRCASSGGEEAVADTW
jgi:hypothetical protein